MGKGKPRGLLAARKLRNHRREQQWADLHYKKRLLGTAYKSSPFGVRTPLSKNGRQGAMERKKHEGQDGMPLNIH